MKNPTRFLCAATVLLFLGADGSRGRDTAKQTTGVADPGGVKTNRHSRSEVALTWACEQPPGGGRERLLEKASFVLSKPDRAKAQAISEPTLRERALSEISNLRTLTTSLQEVQ